MASRASIGGHPIHPMLIPFPIGLLVFSLIADLIYLWRGNPVWENYIAFYTLLGGIIGAAAAAIPGLIDWATLTDRAAVKVANWHARVNIIGLVIFIASFYLRTTSGAKWIVSMPMLPFILSLIGVVGLSIAGYLGGELVFRHGVAVAVPISAQPKSEAAGRVRAAYKHRITERGLMNNRETAYALTRITYGVIYLFYGIGKFRGGISNFVGAMNQQFSGKLPAAMVMPFAYFIPFAETISGALILLGLFTRVGLTLSGILLIGLTFGLVMLGQAPTVAHNLQYVLVNFLLLWFVDLNRYSVDGLLVRKPAAGFTG